MIVFAKQLSVEKLVKALNEIINNGMYQDNAARYRSELLENDFEGKFMDAINKVFDNGKKTYDQS